VACAGGAYILPPGCQVILPQGTQDGLCACYHYFEKRMVPADAKAGDFFDLCAAPIIPSEDDLLKSGKGLWPVVSAFIAYDAPLLKCCSSDPPGVAINGLSLI
jgi:hypothetical protein